eukprot:gene5356-5592_t
MQLLVRGCGSSGTVVVEASPDSTVGALKAAYALKAYGTDSVEPLVLLWNSRQLDDAAALKSVGLEHGASLSACSMLRGGGGDGGSTGAESRSCYLEMYAEKKPDKVNPAEELLARATRCRLSGERLAPPCVADELGSLFNKEALVHALLNKTMPSGVVISERALREVPAAAAEILGGKKWSQGDLIPPKVKETFLCRSTAGRGLGM